MTNYPDPNELIADVRASEAERLDYVMQALKRVDEAVGHADNKASAIGAANIGLISLLLAFAAIAGDRSSLTLNSQQYTIFTALFLIYLIPSVGSLVFAFDALFPRLRGQSTSMFYFGHFNKFPNAQALHKALDAATKADLIQSVEEQIWQVSAIAMTKYQRLRWSVRLCMLSGLIWMLIVVLLFLILVGGLVV